MKHPIERLDRSLDWSSLPALSAWTLEQAVRLQQIPAPTFAERERADHAALLFAELGLSEISVDEVFNVYGLLPGAHRDLPAVMIAAHSDTVFARETDLRTRRDDDTLFGPGLGDNSLGVAGLLALAQTLRQQRILPECDLWFVVTSREEGLGDLGGMRAAFQRLKGRVGAVINLEGMALGHVYHAGIAVRRLRINATTPGGHSWLHFGRPSATHAIIELGSSILTLQTPGTPRTTYNIGMIEGGESINSIATHASLWLDMRSEDTEALRALEAQVRAKAQHIASREIIFALEVVGDRPAGTLTPEHPLVQNALAALAQVGLRGTLETGSTDANIPLSQGCPAVTIGLTRGGNAHRLDEYIEISPIETGLRQLILLTLATAQQLASQIDLQ